MWVAVNVVNDDDDDDDCFLPSAETKNFMAFFRLFLATHLYILQKDYCDC